MKDIIFTKAVKSWSDVSSKWKWYIQYACLTQDGARIDTNMILGDTKEEALKNADKIELAYREEEHEHSTT